MAQRHESVTTQDLALDLNNIIEKVRESGTSVYVTKDAQTVAELAPPPKQGLPVDQLIDLLQSLPSLGDDGPVMAEDLAEIRRASKLPDNPWD